MATQSQALPNRIVSLDQFRGYTILGMFLVNYMGSYKSFVPQILLHHNVSCSYADLIMPHFLFAVGFAFRLTFGRREHSSGLTSAYLRVVRRILGLLVVTFSVYHVGRVSNSWEQLTEMTFWEIFEKPMKRVWLQTLGQIALTSLWILPWLRSSTMTRVIVMCLCGIGHQVACHFGYFVYANTGPAGIDGGPLGFLTWTIPSLLGTIACDWVVDAREKQSHAPLGKMFLWSIVIMTIGWFITWPARLYDISPEEMVVLKEDVYKRRDHVNAVAGARNKPLGEKLKPFNGVLGELRKQVTNESFVAKQENTVAIMKEAGLDPKTDYPTKEMSLKAIEQWEENPPAELKAKQDRLEYYETILKPEIIRPSAEELALKIETARRFEELVIAERDRQTEIREPLMVEAKLDPKKDKVPDEINKKVAEEYGKNPGENIVALRKAVEESKIPYQEVISVYYKNVLKQREKLAPLEGPFKAKEAEVRAAIQTRLMTEAKLDPAKDKPTAELTKKIDAELEKNPGEELLALRNEYRPVKLFTDHMETLLQMEWNKVGSQEWNDLKLAVDPVIPSAERWEKAKSMSLADWVGRNPFNGPERENPQVVNYAPRYQFYWNSWMMSQRAGTVAYLVFAGGFSLLMYTLFYIACDMWGIQVGLFRTWGTNALACYVLFELVCGAVKNFVPKDPEPWYAWGSWVVGMFLMYIVIRSLEKNKIFIRM